MKRFTVMSVVPASLFLFFSIDFSVGEEAKCDYELTLQIRFFLLLLLLLFFKLCL